MSKFPFFVLILLFTSSWLRAQEPEQFVEVRFLFLDESGGQYAVEQSDRFRTVSSYPYAISSPVTHLAGERLSVYKHLPEQLEEEASEHDQQPMTKIGEIRLPNQETEILVVIRPGEKGEPFRARIYPSDTNRFPPSSIRVINLGVSTIAVNVGANLEQIEPGDFKVIEAQADHKHRLITRVAHRTSDDWQMMYDSVLILRPDERITGVVVFSPSGMRHTYTQAELIEFGDPPPRHQWLSYTSEP
ncbi:MAG: hypothetical protein WD708_04110 [Kiritimatiellia bacterium]